MKYGVILPLLAVLVGVAAMTGTIRGTVAGGALMTGAMITAHVCASRAGRWRVPVFALIFAGLPLAMAVALGAATELTLTSGGRLAFDHGQVTRAGLIEMVWFFTGFALLALVIDALAARFLPK